MLYLTDPENLNEVLGDEPAYRANQLREWLYVTPVLSVDGMTLTIKGNVLTSGDIQIEGTIEGDVRAHLVTVGESAVIKGEISADDVVVNGRVIGRLRGLKVRLTATAQVEGDIVHKTIAIESGANFEGTVQRNEDPLGDSGSRAAVSPPRAKSEPRNAAPLTGETASS